MLYYERAVGTAKPGTQHVDAEAQLEDEERAVEERHVILEVGLPRVGGRAGEPQRRDQIPEIISNRSKPRNELFMDKGVGKRSGS